MTRGSCTRRAEPVPGRLAIPGLWRGRGPLNASYLRQQMTQQAVGRAEAKHAVRAESSPGPGSVQPKTRLPGHSPAREERKPAEKPPGGTFPVPVAAVACRNSSRQRGSFTFKAIIVRQPDYDEEFVHTEGGSSTTRRAVSNLLCHKHLPGKRLRQKEQPPVQQIAVSQ